ncbi:hypothetical protein EBU91_03765 [bacterium]|nr:hypothetical protein [bacterium]
MSTQILHFNNHQIESIEIDGKKYISSANMSNALEYSTSKSITNLFNSNREEFTEGEDYMVIDSMTVKNAPYKQIFFSMEGVILITMLAKTQKAVEFRKWAKNTLANLPQIKQLSRMEILQIAMESEKRVLELESTVKEKDIIIEAKDTQIESAKNLFKQVADKTGCIKFKACASLLNITESELKGVLRSNKWIYLNKLFPTTEARINGYVKNLPEEFKVKTKDGKTLNKQRLSFFITERGYYNLLEKVAGITMN